MKEIIEFSAAQSLVLDFPALSSTEKVRLEEMLGRVLAEDILAKSDEPGFDNAAMDGVVIRAADTAGATSENPVRLMQAGKSYAGDAPAQPIGKGEFMRIATGATVPEGADTVVPKELLKWEGDSLYFTSPVEAGRNIRCRGTFHSAGNTLLSAGQTMTPAAIALLASAGYEAAEVYRRPSICIITTGNELVSPGSALSPGKIYNSNSWALSALALQAGARISGLKHAVDRKDELTRTLAEANESSELIVLAGGISVGDKDYVLEVLKDAGAELRFRRINVKPGKPCVFAELPGGRPVFALPGSPVAAYYLFRTLISPFIKKMSGLSSYPDEVLVGRMASIPVTSSSRTELLPVQATLVAGGYVLQPCADFSSANLHIPVSFNALAIVAPEDQPLTLDSRVNFIFV